MLQNIQNPQGDRGSDGFSSPIPGGVHLDFSSPI